MKNQSKFKGTGVAIITPFNKDLSIDFISLERQVEHLISNNINYLVVLGTTGESVTLTEKEKAEVVQFIVEKTNKRVPIVLGMGSNDTFGLVDKINKTNLSQIDGILSVAPYYNKPNQEGLYQHFKHVAEVSPVPVILYNVPGRTSSNISAETTLKLAHNFKNIVAIKEASGDLTQAMYIIKNKPEDFILLSGDDALTLPLISIGGSGVISVIGNALPKEFSGMVQHALNSNITLAQDIHYKLLELYDYLFVDGNPAGVKAALSILDITKDFVRLPLVTATENTYKKIKELISLIKK